MEMSASKPEPDDEEKDIEEAVPEKQTDVRLSIRRVSIIPDSFSLFLRIWTLL